jgi:hypothetical protein
MKVIQNLLIFLLILSIVSLVLVLISMPDLALVEQPHRYSTGVAWLEVCMMLKTNLMQLNIPPGV